MKKNDDCIYELLNYYSVDEDIEAEKLDDLTSKRIERKIKKKINKRNNIFSKVIVATLVIFVVSNVISISINGKSAYANVKVSLIQAFKEIVGDKSQYDKFSNLVNLSSKDKGVEVLVREVVSDGNEISIAYSLISDGDLKEIVSNPNIFMAAFSIDGNDVGGYGNNGEIVNSNRYDGCLTIQNGMNNIDSEFFYLDMKVGLIGNLEGNWNIKIKVENNIGYNVKEYNVNETIKLGKDENLVIDKIITTPLSTSIKVSENSKYNYFVLDDNGNEILVTGESFENGKGSINLRSIFNSDTESLTFIPYEYNEDYKVEYRKYDYNKLPLEISQGALGKLIVNNIQWLDDNTLKVNYESEGIVPVTQSHSIVLIDPDNNTILSDSRFNNQPNILDQKNYEVVFKGIDKNKSYKIGSCKLDNFYKMNENLKFTINLNR